MMEVTFKWDRTFFIRKKKMFEQMQTQLDGSAMKYMDQYVPVALDKYPNSGKLKGTISNPEPGHIMYKGNKSYKGEPVSRHAYYTPMNHLRSGNPQATHKWFETMKIKDAGKIRSELAKISGGKSR